MTYLNSLHGVNTNSIDLVIKANYAVIRYDDAELFQICPLESGEVPDSVNEVVDDFTDFVHFHGNDSEDIHIYEFTHEDHYTEVATLNDRVIYFKINSKRD